MEKFRKNKFKHYPTRYYTNPLVSRFDDSLRHYDLPKKELKPLGSDTLTVNLFKTTSYLELGRYRFRVHLRVRTMPDNTPYNDPNFEQLPPFDKIEYVKSKWFYFAVNKTISRTK